MPQQTAWPWKVRPPQGLNGLSCPTEMRVQSLQPLRAFGDKNQKRREEHKHGLRAHKHRVLRA